jgi:hypothetical protein
MIVDDGTLVENLEEGLARIDVFPNPVKDELFVQSSLPVSQLELLNNSGKSILTENYKAIFFELNLPVLIPGIYFLKLQTDNGIVIKKVIIQ